LGAILAAVLNWSKFLVGSPRRAISYQPCDETMRRLQFSLKTLLWLMLWVALACGCVALVRPPWQQVVDLFRFLTTPRGLIAALILVCLSVIPFLKRHP